MCTISFCLFLCLHWIAKVGYTPNVSEKLFEIMIILHLLQMCRSDKDSFLNAVNHRFYAQGYFGIWLATFISAVLFAQTLRPELAASKKLQYNRALTHFAQAKYKMQLWIVIIVCSIVIWIVGAVQCTQPNVSCTGTNAFGLVCLFCCLVTDLYFSLSCSFVQSSSA